MDRVRLWAWVRLGLVSNSVSSKWCFYQHLCNMNIDQNMLLSYASCCNKWHKTAFFVMNFVKIAQNHSFTKIRMKILCMCNSWSIWQYHPCDIYIHLHTIGLIDAMELGTVTYHFAPNRRRFHSLISLWILLHRNNVFGRSLMSSFSLFVRSFSCFF